MSQSQTPSPKPYPRKSVRAEDVGKRARLMDAVYGETHAEGRVLDYSAAPSITIETDDGRHVSWRADLAEVIPEPDDRRPAVERALEEARALVDELRATMDRGGYNFGEPFVRSDLACLSAILGVRP